MNRTSKHCARNSKTKKAGAKTVVDSMRKKYLVWNDWPIKDGHNGDILATGAWGKIVVFNNKTVVKMPINPYYCIDFANEQSILREIKTVKNAIINVLSTTLSVATYSSDERVRGKVELVKQKYVYNADADLQTSCIFFMNRIYPPKIENLVSITNPDKHYDLHIHHDNVLRPYYVFLGRIGQCSVSSFASRNTDVGTLSLSDMIGVQPDALIPNNVLQNICDNYAGSGMVIANYAVEDGSFPYYVGMSMCKFVWDVFIQKHIILYDTEFVYGVVSGKTKMFIIDCNLCKKIDTPLTNVVKTSLVNHYAAAMDIRIPSVSPEHWGGFLPNPLLSPNFAIHCLNSMVNDDDPFDTQVLHANFMHSFFTTLSTHLSNLDNKGIISKYEKDIKHIIDTANVNFSINIIYFRELPENHIDAIGIEKQIKLFNSQLRDCHAYFTHCYSKAYLLEISLAIGKVMYNKLATADNISYVSSIVSSRVSYWLLSSNFSLENIDSLFTPVTTDEMRLYNQTLFDDTQTKYVERNYDKNVRNIGKKDESLYLFSDIE